MLESAEVKSRTWRWRLTVIGILLAAVVGVWLITTYPVRHPTDSLEGDMGVIQDGVYYAYGGSGFPIPSQTLVPQGIFRYVPGEEKQLIVSREDHQVNSLFNQWAINSHGLYFTDSSDQSLWRLDLETGEETRLTSLAGLTGEPQAETQPDQKEEDTWSVIQGVLTGKTDLSALTEDSAGEGALSLMLDLVFEDEVWMHYYQDDTSYDIKVDSRTGELLEGPTPWQTSSRWGYLQAGDRVIQPVEKDYPEGFTYPKLEQDRKLDLDYWTDYLEDGVSLLPEGMIGDPFVSRSVSGGVLVGYYPMSHLDETGTEIAGAIHYLFLTETGETYSLADKIQGLYPTYLGGAGDWIYFTSSDYENPDPAKRGYNLSVWNLETGETRLLQERFGQWEIVTDGQWLYASNGGRTNCYTVDLDAQGDPCGLTLVEEDI